MTRAEEQHWVAEMLARLQRSETRRRSPARASDEALLARCRQLASKTVTPQMHYHYGALLLKQGDKTNAEVELRKATVDGAAYPGIEDAKAMLSQL